MGPSRELPISFFVSTEFLLNDWHVKLILLHAQEVDVDLIPCFQIDSALELGQRLEMQSPSPVVLLDPGF